MTASVHEEILISRWVELNAVHASWQETCRERLHEHAVGAGADLRRGYC
jgi:hypothetical protein